MNLWLAPLHGITLYHFRNCFLKHFKGIDFAITPFITAQPKEKLNPKKLIDLLPVNNIVSTIIPQLMGNKPDDIKDTIFILQETFGYQQFNWNIGCPVKQIVRKKRGCGMMPFPNLIEETVNEVCSKTTALFSLKMRLGLHSQKEGLEVLHRVASYPIHFLCIHPRSGIQQYEGNVDLDNFETFYQFTNHNIIYCGDITDSDFFMNLHHRFPKIENWMLGRGLLQNPFLAEEISGMRYAVSGERYFENRFIDFYNDYSDLLCELKGEKIALSALKELWHYFVVFWKINAIELKKFLQINDYHEFQKGIEKNIFK